MPVLPYANPLSFAVGYQTIDIPGPASSGTCYSFRTVTFKLVNTSDEDQTYDLTDILPLKADGSAFDTEAGSGKTRCTGGVRLRKMLNNAGDYDTQYMYYSTVNYNGAGWYAGSKGSTSVPVAAKTIYLCKGEGLLITCTVKGGAKLRFSGEVELTDTSFDIPGPATSGTCYCFSGNSTPAKIDLNDITPLKADGTAFDTEAGSGKTRCTGGVRLRKMLNTAGDYDTQYMYYSTVNYNGAGWYAGAKGSTSIPVAKGVVTLDPGEGVLVTCTVKGGAKLQLKKPISE